MYVLLKINEGIIFSKDGRIYLNLITAYFMRCDHPIIENIHRRIQLCRMRSKNVDLV